MKAFLGICLLMVLLALIGQSCGKAIEQELAASVCLTAAQRLEVMSRISEPRQVFAEEQNLAAYDRHLTRTVEEDWRASR